MLRDITIGQYYPAQSVIHCLDPRVKIAGTLAYIISLFWISNIWGYVAAILFFAFLVALSKVPFSYIIRGLKPILFLMAFTGLINLFQTPGKTIWQWGILQISENGIRTAIFLILRLILLVIGSSLMTLTTTPNQLTDGLERLLRPLNRVHIPVHEVAMMMSIALRFIPILIEEADKIMKAQMARGADFESGNIFQRLRNMLPLLVPLFVSAARRANDLAYAMEARCYCGGEGRTKMRPLRYSFADLAAYSCMAVYLILLFVLRRW